jgi:uncharacterized protein YbjQ (UPF0145 family)
MPREIAYGVCSYYIHEDRQTAATLRNYWGGGTANQEVGIYTVGFMQARHLAMQRFSEEVRKSGSTGAVGVRVDWDVEDIEYESGGTTYHDLLVHFAATGTAVVEGAVPASAPTTTLSFHDLRSATCQQTSLQTPSDD